MKIRKIAFILALLLTLMTFAGCGSGKDLMTLGNVSLSENTYQLMLCLQKGVMAPAITAMYGDCDSDAFWDMVVSSQSATNNDYYTYAVNQKARKMLCALALFEDMKLSLPSSAIEEIDKEMENFVAVDGEGSKAALNSILSAYGVNYKLLREYKIMNAKVKYLAGVLFGADGSGISASVKEEYYRDNYVAFKQILLSSSHYVYYTDKFGDDIYYDASGKVMYDTKNGTVALEDGVFVYYRADGHIAYDTENGKRAVRLDENGRSLTVSYSADEMMDRFTTARKWKDQLSGESAVLFEEFREQYSNEEFGSDFDPEALSYLATSVTYGTISEEYRVLDTIAEKLADMEVGEVALVQTDAGFHILRKYALSTGAYANEENSQWFEDTGYGIYDFTSNLMEDLFAQKLSAYDSRIVVNEKIKNALTIKDVVPDYDFY